MGLSLIAAATWGCVLQVAAAFFGGLYRKHHTGGAIEMLDDDIDFPLWPRVLP